METKLDVVGRSPKIYYSPSANRVMLEMELIEFQGDLGQPSESGILLGMTAGDAVLLLGLLKSLQQQFGWPDPPTPLSEQVPPHSERN